MESTFTAAVNLSVERACTGISALLHPFFNIASGTLLLTSLTSSKIDLQLLFLLNAYVSYHLNELL